MFALACLHRHLKFIISIILASLIPMGGHSAAQDLVRAQACAVFRATEGRSSMQKQCTHAVLLIKSTVQSHSNAARVRVCSLAQTVGDTTALYKF